MLNQMLNHLLVDAASQIGVIYLPAPGVVGGTSQDCSTLSGALGGGSPGIDCYGTLSGVREAGGAAQGAPPLHRPGRATQLRFALPAVPIRVRDTSGIINRHALHVPQVV